jgi:hypothetical protein
MSESKRKVNPFFKMMVDNFKAFAPKFFHPCPYFGVESINTQWEFFTFWVQQLFLLAFQNKNEAV